MNKGVPSGVAAENLIPAGVIWEFGGNAADIPVGWLLCDGSAVNRAQYSRLFKAIGVLHGSGNGTTTFNLPNRQGRVGVGQDGSAEFANVGSVGGSKTTTASHTHATTTGTPSSTNTDVPSSNSTSYLSGNTGGQDAVTWWVNQDHAHGTGFMYANASNHTHFYNNPNAGGTVGLTPGSNTYQFLPLGAQTGTGYVDHQHGTYGEDTNHNHNMNSHVHDHSHGHDLQSHTHSMQGHTHTGTSGDSSTTASAGNLSPYVAVNYMVKI
jgi:microcystin-dependent protein